MSTKTIVFQKTNIKHLLSKLGSVITNRSVTKHLIVDLELVSFLDSNALVIISCLLELFKDAKIEFKVKEGDVLRHLRRINYLDYWNNGFDRSSLTQPQNGTSLPPWKISPEMITTYPIYAKKYFQQFAPSKDLTPLESNMYEVFNNILDHSESVIEGYIMAQFYPANSKLFFSICDFGVGIPTVVRRKSTHPKDCSAILKALEYGFSTETKPHNRGFGLHNLLTFSQVNKGELVIVSNRGYVKIESGSKPVSYDLINCFKGTLIYVAININCLSNSDDTVEEWEF